MAFEDSWTLRAFSSFSAPTACHAHLSFCTDDHCSNLSSVWNLSSVRAGSTRAVLRELHAAWHQRGFTSLVGGCQTWKRKIAALIFTFLLQSASWKNKQAGPTTLLTETTTGVCFMFSFNFTLSGKGNEIKNLDSLEAALNSTSGQLKKERDDGKRCGFFALSPSVEMWFYSLRGWLWVQKVFRVLSCKHSLKLRVCTWCGLTAPAALWFHFTSDVCNSALLFPMGSLTFVLLFSSSVLSLMPGYSMASSLQRTMEVNLGLWQWKNWTHRRDK